MDQIQIHSEDYTTVKCPVGKEFLVFRKPYEKVEAYCMDCNRTYLFEQYSSTPVRSYRGRREDRFCHCQVCKDRLE